MGYLLDTHIVLWLANEPNKLANSVKEILVDKNLIIYFSAVNLWEIAIKNQLDKHNFSVDVEKLYHQLIKHDFIELPVYSKHTWLLKNLSQYHKDPFDRLLIAQAMSEDLTLITHDGSIWQYEQVKILKA